MKSAFDLKDEGNFYFKQKDYKKAISKYVKVQLYIKPLAPPEISASDMDPTLKMMGGMKQFNLSDEELKACRELQATAYLNMAICHHINKDYEKAIKNGKLSIDYNNKVIKAHYRLG